MKVKRAAALVLGAGALAAWIAAAATSGHRDVTLAPALATPLDSSGATLASEIARLHERLRPATPPRVQRNLFQFSPRRRPAPAIARRPALTEAIAQPVVPTRPALKLIGVAEDASPDGPVRTAIISGLGQLFLVKEGEDVTLRYRVSRISADVVELTDTGDSSIVRLALK